MDNNDLENMKLADLFDLGWKEQRELSKTSMCEQSSDYLMKRKKAVEILKKCEFMLDELHLFSDNESLEEVSTSELRYFLNYALLGWLFNKVNSHTAAVRLAALLEAKSSYLQYLVLTKNYELHKFNIDKMSKTELENDQAKLEKVVLEVNRQASFDANLTSMAYDRNEKIKRYKEQKEFEKQMETLAHVLDSAKREQIDDETRRQFFMTAIKYWINQAVDDLKCVNDEISILRSIELEKNNNPEQTNRMHASTANAIDSLQSNSKQPGKKPFIITKDAMQAKVFGMGYPSLPVYSIEEFYDQKAEEGHMPKVVDSGVDDGKGGVQIGGGVTESQKQDDKAKKDALEDADDEEELYRQRGWDEFKDENKRGAGNTYNRS